MDGMELLVNIIIKGKRELYNISLESGIILNRGIILLRGNTKGW
jgi:hypothetical protein